MNSLYFANLKYFSYIHGNFYNISNFLSRNLIQFITF